MIKTIILTIALLPISFAAQAVDGMIDVASHHSVTQTADNLEKVLKSKGMKIFGRVPHSKAAKGVGIELLPMELLIFGNPKVGSPLMKCANSVAIDLPQKALIWQDSSGSVWISYNDPQYLKKRHNIQGCDAVLAKVSGALSKFTAAAAK
jgi:uncharacterized protein (DUF302 family)